MSLLSANQLYNISGAEQKGLKFKDWLQNEQETHKIKVEKGKITGKMPFLHWLNVKWTGVDKLNAEGKGFLSGEFGEALQNVARGVVDKTVGAKSGAATVTPVSVPIVIEKRILGMKPGVAIAVGAVVVLAATVITIKLVQRAKK